MAFIKINNDYTRCSEFLKFSITPAFGIWFFFAGQIVRYTGGAPGAQRMFYMYFMGEKWLCSSYSIENVAIYFKKFNKKGQPDKSWVSKHTRILESTGLLEKIKDGRRVVYKLGYYIGEKGKPDYNENLFFDEYFGPKAKKAKLKRIEEREERYKQTITSGWEDRISKLNEDNISDEQLELLQL